MGKLDNFNTYDIYIRGDKIIEIDGEGSKEYKLNFSAPKSGVYKFKLTFLNEENGEYMLYNFTITVEES